MCGTEEAQTIEPQVNILCSAPGFTVPYPDDVDAKLTESNTIFNWGGVTIAKISPTIAVKFGSHVRLSEAKNIMFVEQNIDTPYFHQLRQLRHENYIGSADFGPVTDPFLETYFNKGPFDSEESFNNTIIEAYQLKAPKRHIKSFLVGMLSQKRYQIVFTHGDLRPQNIIVNHGNISGIVDWEFSGWYPEFWAFSKALYVWKWQNDWTNYLIQFLEPYYSEYAVHSFLTEVLW
ncbi:kinase-like protein [Aspergillus pseudonomiae]|uniref:Kinase-like protein n=1 Tax=Aspergillus pseudonomiae TaxID=1506151 RepID=A0A5N7DR53_9EURO|nr:kinase-like protein [Aspergillus pseudonomiae]KAE8408866.1 kinase-like protein [Aspergillus pseudonomiae]